MPKSRILNSVSEIQHYLPNALKSTWSYNYGVELLTIIVNNFYKDGFPIFDRDKHSERYIGVVPPISVRKKVECIVRARVQLLPYNRSSRAEIARFIILHKCELNTGTDSAALENSRHFSNVFRSFSPIFPIVPAK